MPTCPNGHQSGSDDWCEVCGHRMAGAVPPPPPPTAGGYGFPPPAPGAPAGGPMGGGRHLSAVPNAHEPELCPQCRTPREGGAPFCEECRWNFLTNTATSYTPAAPRPPAGGPGPAAPTFRPPAPPTFGGGDSYEYQGSRPSQVNRPAEPIPSFGSEPSGPTPFAGERGGQSAFGADRGPSAPPPGPSGPPGQPGFGGDRGQPGPPAFGGDRGQPGPPAFGGPDRGQSGPPAFGGDRGQPGPPAFGGGDRGQSSPPPFGGERGPSSPPPPYGGAPGQNAGGPSAFGAPPGAGQPSGPYTRDPSGGPGAGPFGGADPSRPPVPPPGGPGATTGGAPGAYQQSAPTGFPQETRPPAGGPAFGGGDDDWVISPPGPAGGPAGPGAPARPGGYGYPQPGATQAPPGPAFPQAPQGPATWIATIGPDRAYFMAMMQRSGPEAAGLNLPAYSPEQQRTLTGNQVTIGRRRHSTGDTPDIDLSVPPEDPGVSHQHAVLVQQPDGSWAVVDQNSTNGTTVNGGEEPIQPFVPVPLQDGDRVHVGAWTTITVRRG
ncbi:FHA domain-containing protein [Streptomyces sp. NPDC047061]|uniref:FHA domain-containing protein n=1 Tax=Streptomyces sp. NPDC047061 TaxID=3154605 RepID=UPI0033DD6037